MGDNSGVIPGNAYFNAAEAAAKYSTLDFKLAPYRSGMTYYHSAFARLLQYVEIFPYNPEAILELAKQSNEMGKPELFMNYVLPLAASIESSSAIQVWKDDNGPAPFLAKLDILHKAIPEIILKANAIIYLQSKGSKVVNNSLKLRLNSIEKQIKFLTKRRKVRLDADDYSQLSDDLEYYIEELSGDRKLDSSPQKANFVEELKQIRDEVQELIDANRILAELPEYIKISKEIRKSLAQQIDHPIHKILHQHFNEHTLDNKYYNLALTNIKNQSH